MSALEEKLERTRESGGKARRTHSSLLACRGYRVEEPGRVSIRPMDVTSTWKHVGNGKWDAAGAEYEKVEGEGCGGVPSEEGA